jgi:UPF0716 protein FxsA
MAIVLLLAFIITPIVEIAVFIEIGGEIGLWPTLAIVVITAMVGTALLRAQGLATFAGAQQSLARGEFPVRQVFDGACLLVAGALLLTPGFVTDGVGLALFLPPVRNLLRRWVLARGRFQVDAGMDAGPRPGREDGIVEGEFHEVEGERDTEPPPRTPLR